MVHGLRRPLLLVLFFALVLVCASPESANAGHIAEGGGRRMRIALINTEAKNRQEYESVARQVIESFKNMEPFRSRFSQLEFQVLWNTSDLKCGFLKVGSSVDSNRKECDRNATSAAISAQMGQFDFAFVIFNDGHFFIDVPSGNFVFMDMESSKEGSFQGVALHEFGHAFAGLDDEYDYGPSTLASFDYLKGLAARKSGWVNCFETKEEALAQPFVGAMDVTPGCTVNTRWRTTRHSNMFSPVSTWWSVGQQKVLSRALDRIVGPLKDSEAPTVRFLSEPQVKVISIFGNSPERALVVLPEVKDNIGVSAVQLLIDGVPWSTSAASPEFKIVLSNDQIPLGSHRYQLRAMDLNGNQSESEVMEYASDPRQATLDWYKDPGPDSGGIVMVRVFPGTFPVKAVRIFINGAEVGTSLPPSYGWYKFIPKSTREVYAIIEYEGLGLKTKVPYR